MGALSPHGSDPTASRIVGWLRSGLPTECGASLCAIVDRPASAFAIEEQLIERAVAQRRNEFRAGRAAAREALAQLGCEPAAIACHAQRDPLWPEGIVGSISHCPQLAVAIAARSGNVRGIGVDIEADAALEPRLVAAVCGEQQHTPDSAQALLRQRGIDYAKLCFVAKEAVIKCIFPQRRVAPALRQIELRFEVAAGRFEAWLEPQSRLDAEDGLGGGSWGGLSGGAVQGKGRFLHCAPWLLATFVNLQQPSGVMQNATKAHPGRLR